MNTQRLLILSVLSNFRAVAAFINGPQGNGYGSESENDRWCYNNA